LPWADREAEAAEAALMAAEATAAALGAEGAAQAAFRGVRAEADEAGQEVRAKGRVRAGLWGGQGSDPDQAGLWACPCPGAVAAGRGLEEDRRAVWAADGGVDVDALRYRFL